MRRWFLIALIAPIVILPSSAQDKKKAPLKPEPRIHFAVPLGAAPGKATKITLRGSNLDDAREVKVLDGQGSVKLLNKGKAAVPDKNPEKVGDTQVEIELTPGAKVADGGVLLIVVTSTGETKPHRVLVETALPVIIETEANDGFRDAQAINLPVVVAGAINRQRDVDVFRFSGKKGQKITAEVLASRHGSPLDSILTLYDAKGQQLADNDDFQKEHRDARIETILPADGVYYLSLIDAHDSGSNLHVYRLSLKR